jgi:hypothetical protein
MPGSTREHKQNRARNGRCRRAKGFAQRGIFSPTAGSHRGQSAAELHHFWRGRTTGNDCKFRFSKKFAGFRIGPRVWGHIGCGGKGRARRLGSTLGSRTAGSAARKPPDGLDAVFTKPAVEERRPTTAMRTVEMNRSLFETAPMSRGSGGAQSRSNSHHERKKRYEYQGTTQRHLLQ